MYQYLFIADFFHEMMKYIKHILETLSEFTFS